VNYVIGIKKESVKQMKNKKAASQIIAWVLLLGLTISLAIGVYQFTKGQAEGLTDSTVTSLEGNLECENVKINVKPDGSCATLDITNTGTITVDKISIVSLGNPKSVLKEVDLAPKQKKVGFSFDGYLGGDGDIQVTPIITIKNKDMSCKTSKATITC
jgi:hypothetical protein